MYIIKYPIPYLTDIRSNRITQVRILIQGRITVDRDTEAFETPGDATQLDLSGSLYIGSVDYMDPYLRLPPSLWSTTLR